MKTSSRNIADRFAFESLEGREVKAGNVAAAVLGGSLQLFGDNHDNGIKVTQVAANQFKVEGANVGGATTINGKSSVVFKGIVNDLSIDTKGGSDIVSVGLSTGPTASVGRDLKVNSSGTIMFGAVNMKVGRDVSVQAGVNGSFIAFSNDVIGRSVGIINQGGGTVQLSSTKISQNLAVLTAGAVSIENSNVGGDAAIWTGQGDDSISVSGGNYGHDLQIRTGDGNNKANVTGAAVKHNLSIEGGEQNDQINVVGVGVKGNVQVSSAGGQDSLLLAMDTVFGEYSIDMGAGDDVLSLQRPVGRAAKLNMGAGVDTLWLLGPQSLAFQSQVASYERYGYNPNA